MNLPQVVSLADELLLGYLLDLLDFLAGFVVSSHAFEAADDVVVGPERLAATMTMMAATNEERGLDLFLDRVWQGLFLLQLASLVEELVA